MPQDSLRHILLIQAIEEADEARVLLPGEERRAAAREASGALGADVGADGRQRFFARRAELLLDRLEERYPPLGPALVPSRPLRLAVPLLLAAAAAAGWSTQALGTEKLVNILSVPLIGILAWNLGVYLLEALRAASRRLPRGGAAASPWPALLPLTRLAGGIPGLPPPATAGEDPLPLSLRRGHAAFQARWAALAAPSAALRLRAALHLAAALLAAAAVAGMYAKGAANEYRAYWESTFFTPGTLQGLLGAVLGPASAVSGLPVPEVESLRRVASSPEAAGENAAIWIHLYAVTMGLFVAGPRLVLASLHAFLARRRDRSLGVGDLPGGALYFDRVIAETTGTTLAVRAIPYCHQLSPAARNTLVQDLEEALGVPARLDWAVPVSLGEEEEAPARLFPQDTALPPQVALCFDLAATPEQESHAAFIGAIRERLAESGGSARLHICLDGEAFDRARCALPDFAGRRAERLANWLAAAGPARGAVRAFPPQEAIQNA